MRTLRQNEMRVKGGSKGPASGLGPVRIEPPSVEVDVGIGNIRMIPGEIFFDLDKAVGPSCIPLGTEFEKQIGPLGVPTPTD